MSTNMGVTPQDKPLSVTGRNWGDADLEGMLGEVPMISNELKFSECLLEGT